MQRHQNRQVTRQVVVREVQTVHMDQVDADMGKRAIDCGLIPPAAPEAVGVVEDARGNRRGKERSRGLGTLTGHYERGVARGGDGAIEIGEHLLGTTDSMGTNGRERVRDTQNGSPHASTGVERSSASASAASWQKRAERMPQSKRS